jgi:sporulation integral membrane protein YtvI
MEQAKKSEFLLNILWYAAVGAAVLIGVRFLLPGFVPLLGGLGLAVLVHPLAGWMCRKLHFSCRTANLAAALLCLGGLAALLWGIGLVVWVQCESLLHQLPALWQTELLPFFQRLTLWLSGLANRFLPGSGSSFSGLAQWTETALQEWITELSSTAVMTVGHWLKGLPLLLLTVTFTLITTLMVLWNYGTVTGFLARQLPARGVKLLHRIKGILTGSVLQLAKAYAILFAVTLAELSLGLWLLGINKFLVAALIIATVDLLPVLGSGLVLGSWSAVVLVGGNLFLGIGLLALWGIISLVRSFLEPKIVGDRIGLPPLVTLTAMYFGLRLGGVAGLLCIPILCMVLVRLQADGILRIYK